MTAWAFAAVGLGASRGVSTAVVYGVMVFVASLPGAVVLVVAWLQRIRSERRPVRQVPFGLRTLARLVGGSDA